MKILFLLIALLTAGCQCEHRRTVVLFLGVDVSGSFRKSPHYKDALAFASHYMFTHMKGYGTRTDLISHLWVGPLGGNRAGGDVKPLYPIHTFKDKDPPQILEELNRVLPDRANSFTNYNIFFTQVASTVRDNRLGLRPLVIMLLTDGVPDTGAKGANPYRSIDVEPLEDLSRDITLRVLYVTTKSSYQWREEVPRKRVKLWTQPADIMRSWNDPSILDTKKAWPERVRFFKWIQDNVDWSVPRRRVHRKEKLGLMERFENWRDKQSTAL